MRMHEIKIGSEYFESAERWGPKRYELRKDDRYYEIGDIVVMKEWDGLRCSGRELMVKIKHVLKDHAGLSDGYCIWTADFLTSTEEL